MPLYEKYRPRTLSEVVGQPKAVARAKNLIERGAVGGQSFWIAGATGTGKTTIARILAYSIADSFFTNEYDSADQFNQAELDRMSDSMGLTALAVMRRVADAMAATGAPVARMDLYGDRHTGTVRLTYSDGRKPTSHRIGE